MKEIIEILKMIRYECYNDNDMDLSLDRIDVLAISALDKLKAQEEAERFVVKVEIPEVYNEEGHARCSILCPLNDGNANCKIDLAQDICYGSDIEPGPGCPCYQK